MGLALPVMVGVEAPPSVSMVGLGVACLSGIASTWGRGRAICLMTAFVFAGLSNAPTSHTGAAVPSGLVWISVEVVDVQWGASDISTRVVVREGRRLVDGARVWPGMELMLRGRWDRLSRFRALVRLRASEGFLNEIPAVRWPWRTSLGGYGVVVGRPTRVGPARLAAGRLIGSVRGDLRAGIQAHTSPAAGGVVRAMTLGEPGAISRSDADTIRGAGLAHFLAISGMHVGLLTGATLWVMGWAVRRGGGRFSSALLVRLPALICVPVPPIIAIIGGGSASAWRAATMLMLALVIRASGRRLHAPRLLAATCLVLTAVSPRDAFSFGAVLSFLATAAILRVLVDEPKRWVVWLWLATAPGLATAPIVWWWFGALSPWMPVSNCLIAPLASVSVIPASWLHAFAAAWAPGLTVITRPVMEYVAGALVSSCGALVGVCGPFEVPPPTCMGLCGAALLCWSPLVIRAGRKGLGLMLIGVVILCSAEAAQVHQQRPIGYLRLTSLDIGQGDAHLVDLPDGRLMVIDAGGGTQAGLRVLAPTLRARRRRHIDVLVFTHAHPDHWSAFPSGAAGISVGEVWVPQLPHAGHSAAYQTLLSGLAQSGTRIVTADTLCGDRREFGGVSARVLSPCSVRALRREENDRSLVISLRYRNRNYLFTGDVEGAAEAELIERGVLPHIDVLKVAHHGSRTSSGIGFLRLVSPRWAVVSCGRQNRFGHPHIEVVSRLVRGGATVLRTDLHGAVEIIQRGDRLAFRTASGLRGELVSPPREASRSLPNAARRPNAEVRLHQTLSHRPGTPPLHPPSEWFQSARNPSR